MALIHSPNIVTNGLILALDAANVRSYPGSGTSWFDLSGSGNTVNLNTNVYNSEGVTSSFNGNFSASSGGAIVYSGRSQLTVDLWIRTPNDFTSANQRSVLYPVGTNSTGGWGLLTSRANTHSFNLILMPVGGDMGGGATSWYYGYRDTSIGNNQWTNFSFSYLGSRSGGTHNVNMVEAFINGQLNPNRYAIHSATMTSTIGGNGTAASFGTSGFENVGQRIGIVRIYDRALTQSELIQNYLVTKGRYGI
jgi:hypothetical protein